MKNGRHAFEREPLTENTDKIEQKEYNYSWWLKGTRRPTSHAKGVGGGCKAFDAQNRRMKRGMDSHTNSEQKQRLQEMIVIWGASEKQSGPMVI